MLLPRRLQLSMRCNRQWVLHCPPRPSIPAHLRSTATTATRWFPTHNHVLPANTPCRRMRSPTTVSHELHDAFCHWSPLHHHSYLNQNPPRYPKFPPYYYCMHAMVRIRFRSLRRQIESGQGDVSRCLPIMMFH